MPRKWHNNAKDRGKEFLEGKIKFAEEKETS
jgi:hypothetical protein